MFLSRFLLAICLTIISTTGVKAACAPFPTSKYLGAYSHAQIKDYVETQQNGNWSSYLSLLQENVQRLQDMNLSGEGAVLRVKGSPTRLSANQLTRFIYVSQQWLEVAQCLSAEAAASQTALSIDDLSNFATAVGGDISAFRAEQLDNWRSHVGVATCHEDPLTNQSITHGCAPYRLGRSALAWRAEVGNRELMAKKSSARMKSNPLDPPDLATASKGVAPPEKRQPGEKSGQQL